MRLFQNRKESRFLIVGLGNPGKQYRLTRHNIGYEALDYLAKEFNIKVSRVRFSALTGEGVICGVKVILAKPVTYMNLSGQAVAAIVKYYGIEPESILVICDDVNLHPGVIRIREKGSSGGQNGLLSIEDMLATSVFKRLRIGIGKPAAGELKDYVLSMPSSAERNLINTRLKDLPEAVQMIITGRLSEAQGRYNGTG